MLGLLAGQTKITTVRFADDGAGFAESVAGMHRLLMGLDAYFEDCQQFNTIQIYLSPSYRVFTTKPDPKSASDLRGV